jgi:L-ribulokinase
LKTYVIGLDYGSDSVRAVLIDTQNGAELASEVFWYPRWKKQQYCNPGINQFRQHPLDHIEGLEHTITSVISESGVSPEAVVSICIDTTGSSPLPLSKEGTPLALVEGFKENPNALMVLWKDHTSVKEANEINELARSWGREDYTKYEGGIYSSEWFWAKILHIARQDKAVKEAAYTWMEHCDYMTYMLVDNQDLKSFKRSRCAAGHKAMWHESWNGLPAKEFLTQLDPYLAELRGNLYNETYTSDEIAGHLNKEWADKLGLTTNTVITVGTFDAHSGAVGAKVDKHALVRVMGTSTCDIMVADEKML